MVVAEVISAIIITTRGDSATTLTLVGEMSVGLSTSSMGPGECLRHF